MEAFFHIRLMIVMSVIVWLSMNAMANPNVGYVNHTCEGKNDPNGDYQAALDIVIPRVITRTAKREYNYCAWKRIKETHAFGCGACNGLIPKQDCRVCLRVADQELYKICGLPTRAFIELVDCRMKFWDQPFLRFISYRSRLVILLDEFIYLFNFFWVH